MKSRAKGRDVHGILLLDKATGLSSNDALQQVKRLFNARKAGHTGSLDRLATGLLPLCFGEATKISAYLLDADKHYQATFRLGLTTTTGDAEGDILEQRAVEEYSRPQVEAVLARFMGPQTQIPPMHSALKRQGQPLYKLARQGITVEREARDIVIHELRLLDLDGESLRVQVHCSKGTYIRTLAEDIGAVLGCGAHVSALRRVGVGPYSDMITYQQLLTEAEAGPDALDRLLLPLESALSDWPEVRVSEDLVFYLKQGQAVQVSGAPSQGRVRLVSKATGLLFALGEITDDGRITSRRLLLR